MIIGIIEAPAVVAADVSIALYRVDKSSGAVIHLAAVASIGSIDGINISLDLLHLLLDGSLIGEIFLLHLFDIDGCQFVMHRYAPPVQRYSTRFFRKSKTNFDFSAPCGMIQKRN